ncbi:MAG: DNA topoisomerase VI subunit B [Thermoproteota archaeon]|nr:DNA topoisomerase VI subunit B [Candidatus Brockarchaeota archaeon]
MSSEEKFKEISPADFFYRNRDIAGFSNPVRALYTAVRELVENSLDACEARGILPDIILFLTIEGQADSERNIVRIRIADNGGGIPPEHIPNAFGKILFGSKYTLIQSRGTFGLGGKMAYLYGQITTNNPLEITVGYRKRIYFFKIMIDIKKNAPIVLEREEKSNPKKWNGTIVSFTLEGDYFRAFPKILEYIKLSALVAPYANITLVDTYGRLIRFSRSTGQMPNPPKETLPHPHGVDVEMVKRLVEENRKRTLISFLTRSFHRVGKETASRILEQLNLSPNTVVGELGLDDIVRLTQALKNYDGFLPPDASILSPIGETLLKEGIKKELEPEVLAVESRKPQAYSGHPFIVEVGIAYGGKITPPEDGNAIIYRYANRIPLLYDEANDVSYKVVNKLMNWKRYRIDPRTDPVRIIVHICSTKIPYKTVGKEYVADRPEIEREILNGLRNVSREISFYLSRKKSMEREKRRLDVYRKYLPLIIRFAEEAAGGRVKVRESSVKTLLSLMDKYQVLHEEAS